MLPLSFQNHLQLLLETTGINPKSLKIAQKQLTDRYRTLQPKSGSYAGFSSLSEAVVYTAVRLPATFSVMESILPHVPLDSIDSILDLGSGPGTATLAAALHWPKCKRFHLIETDERMIKISQGILKDIPEITHQHFSFAKDNLLTLSLRDSYDLVILSYVLSELSIEDQAKVLEKTWHASKKGIIIVMPGTPVGYQQLMVLREHLIRMGAFIAAPCPHHKACPLMEKDWCHFSARFARSSSHREIKGASLPYEDEKFSYLVALQGRTKRPYARVIRKPMRRSGHILLDLCTPKGLKRKNISRRDKGIYKAITKVEWGRAIDETLIDTKLGTLKQATKNNANPENGINAPPIVDE